MFENITQSYDKSDASFEILFLLLVAFILGYLIRFFIGAKYKTRVGELEDELDELQNSIDASRVHSDVSDDEKEKLNAEILALKTNHDKLNSEIQSLRSTHSKLNADYLALKSENGKLQSKVSELQTVVDKHASAPAQPIPLISKSRDDLKQIEGIGPKIEQLLKNDGIETFEALSKAKVDRLKTILKNGGERFRMHDPSTWPRQAKMAAKGQWVQLVRWQDALDGGRE